MLFYSNHVCLYYQLCMLVLFVGIYFQIITNNSINILNTKQQISIWGKGGGIMMMIPSLREIYGIIFMNILLILSNWCHESSIFDCYNLITVMELMETINVIYIYNLQLLIIITGSNCDSNQG